MIQMYHVYKTVANTTVLEDVNLQVEKGEFLFLLGPSGAGKGWRITTHRLSSQGRFLSSDGEWG